MYDTTRKAVVVVNFDNIEDEVEVNIDNVKGGKAELCIPFQNDTIISSPAKFKVPARTCAVVVQINE